MPRAANALNLLQGLESWASNVSWTSLTTVSELLCFDVFCIFQIGMIQQNTTGTRVKYASMRSTATPQSFRCRETSKETDSHIGYDISEI